MHFWPWFRPEPGDQFPWCSQCARWPPEQSAACGPVTGRLVLLFDGSEGDTGDGALVARYIEISMLLDTTRPGPERSQLVNEMHELER